MALSQRLDLRQSQSLVMTPQLQQAIKLLQYSSAELSNFIEDELIRNPLLDRQEGQLDKDPSIGDTTAPDERLSPDQPADSLEALRGDGDFGDQAGEADYTNSYDADIAGAGAANADIPVAGDPHQGHLSYSQGAGHNSFDSNQQDIFERVSSQICLRTHLENQVPVDISDPVDRFIALALIDNLDDAGWLGQPLENIARDTGCSLADVARVLEQVQQFDPAGLFARSLAECLCLQLKDKGRYSPAMEKLLENLDLLAQRDAQKLMKICKIDSDTLTEMVAEIRTLDPKPATRFTHFIMEPVIPDVFVRMGQEDDWLVELNENSLPKVLVNHKFYAKISRTPQQKQDKDYVSEQFQTASWLVKSLQQRAATILKVSSEIVRQQDGFLRHGVSHLRPLVLRDVANAVDMHESTISRVTSSKYIATPRGTYELKYFFTAAIAGMSGENNHSAEAVRHRIKALTDKEEAKKILSDDKLVTLLKTEGIDIARRTVAKYRESLGIPSSVQRRRAKNRQL